MPGARGAIERQGIRFHVEREAVQAAERRRDGERELRARAEPGMRGNGLPDHDPVTARQAEMLRQSRQLQGGPLGLRPARPNRRRRGLAPAPFPAHRAPARGCRSVGPALRSDRETRDAGAPPTATVTQFSITKNSSRDFAAEGGLFGRPRPRIMVPSRGCGPSVAETGRAINDERTSNGTDLQRRGGRGAAEDRSFRNGSSKAAGSGGNTRPPAGRAR